MGFLATRSPPLHAPAAGTAGGVPESSGALPAGVRRAREGRRGPPRYTSSPGCRCCPAQRPDSGTDRPLCGQRLRGRERGCSERLHPQPGPAEELVESRGPRRPDLGSTSVFRHLMACGPGARGSGLSCRFLSAGRRPRSGGCPGRAGSRRRPLPQRPA